MNRNEIYLIHEDTYINHINEKICLTTAAKFIRKPAAGMMKPVKLISCDPKNRLMTTVISPIRI